MKGVDQFEPRVGIFWLLGDRLILDASPLCEAEPYGDCLTHYRSHIDFWAEQQRFGAVPPDIEYEEPPRGRVVFNTRTQRLTLYADRCILKRKSVVVQIMKAMHLSTKQTDATTDESDAHYKCTRCLRLPPTTMILNGTKPHHDGETHMNDLMLNTAQELSNGQAGGHGDRWSVLAGGDETIIRKLMATIGKAELFDTDLVDKAAAEAIAATGEPLGALLLYTGQEKGTSRTGAMSLIGQAPGGTGRRQLWSAYPFFGNGVEVDGVVDELLLHPNRVEAVLKIGRDNGAVISAFDPLFCLHRGLYRAGETYRFSLSAMAYTMEPAEQRGCVVDIPDKVRGFRAADAWATKHGKYTKIDEEAALAAWQPETPEDLEPIRIDASHMTILWPTGFSDDFGYMGEIVSWTPDAVRMLGTSFWRVDVTLVSCADENLTVPIYVAENLFEGDWRPSVGEYVAGNLWMQAYAKALL